MGITCTLSSSSKLVVRELLFMKYQKVEDINAILNIATLGYSQNVGKKSVGSLHGHLSIKCKKRETIL